MINGNQKENYEKIVIGTAQFGMNYGIANKLGRISADEMSSILIYAKSKGINTLDTAIGYGDCHNKLGNLGIEELEIISKFSHFGNDISQIKLNLLSQITKSLKELKISSFNTILLHSPNDLLNQYKYEVYDALISAKNNGLCKKIGVSGYCPKQIINLTKEFKIDVIQLPFNVFNNEIANDKILNYLKFSGMELHVRSIFLQGLLLMESHERNPYFDNWKELFEKWELWLKQNKISKLEGCISYVLQNKFIDKVVIGIDSKKHFCEILNVFKNSNTQTIPDIFSSSDQNLINPINWPV